MHISYQNADAKGYPSPSSTRIVGSCTGLLAAAAVGSAQSLVDLIPVAVEAVKTAFRLGVLVAEARDEIEGTCNQSSSWSAVLPGLKYIEASDILASFHNERVRVPMNISVNFI